MSLGKKGGDVTREEGRRMSLGKSVGEYHSGRGEENVTREEGGEYHSGRGEETDEELTKSDTKGTGCSQRK